MAGDARIAFMTERYTVSIEPEHTNIFHYKSTDPTPPKPEPIHFYDFSALGLLSHIGQGSMRILETIACIGTREKKTKV